MADKRVIELEVNDNIGSLRTQLRNAQAEVAELSAKFGETSQQAINAAKNAAELKERIADAKALTDAFNPDAKFNALASSIGGVLNGFQAYEGALGLIGVESKDLQETLLKVQSAMALTQGINGVLESVDSFKQLGAVIGQTAIGQKILTAGTVVYTGVQKALNFVMKQNPIFLVIGGVTALAGAFAILTSRTEDQIEVEKRLQALRNKRNEEVNKELEQELKKREVRKGGLVDLENEVKILRAKGATDKEIFEAEKKIIQEKLTLLGYAEGKRGKLNRDEYKEKKQLQTDLEVLELEFNAKIKNAQKNRLDETKKTNQELLDEQRRLADQLKQDLLDIENEEIAREKEKNQKKIDQQTELNEGIAEAGRVLQESQRSEQENELQAVTDKYRRLFDLAEQFGQDQSVLVDAQNNELNEINLKYAQDEIDANKEKNDKIDADNKALAEKEKERKRELANFSLDVTKSGLQGISDLVQAFAGKSRAQQKKAFETAKALNIAIATIDTIKGAIGAFMAAQNLGYPANLIVGGISAAAVAASGAAQIAKISKTKFDGGGDVGSSPNVNVPNANAGQSQPPQTNQIGNVTQQQLFEQKPIQAFVVSGEVTSQQALDRNRLKNATFG